MRRKRSTPFYKGYRKLNWRFPLPSNDAELALLTNWFFGKALSLSALTIHGNHVSYRVREKYNSYHGGSGDLVSSTGSYDVDREFWKRVVGELYCGGTAGFSYGQTRIAHRGSCRLRRWVNSRRGKGSSKPRKAFERLAARSVGAERTE